MNTSYQTSKKTIYEGTDKAAYKTFKAEILRHAASGVRLDEIVDAGIYAGANVIINSVSLNRLNALSIALKDCKENARLAKIARVPAYLGMENCIAFNKEHGVFIITDYVACKALAKNLKIPTVKFLTWCKENKIAKKTTLLTEKQAIEKIRTLYTEMRDSHFINTEEKFQGILTALQEYVETYDQEYSAIKELEKLREIIS